MPIYAFRCDACAHEFDRLQKLADPDPANCPVCEAAGIRRKLTAPSFRLSGSGWYETDFKSAGDRKRNLAGDAGESPSKPATGDATKGASESSGSTSQGTTAADGSKSAVSSKVADAAAKSTPSPKPAATSD